MKPRAVGCFMLLLAAIFGTPSANATCGDDPNITTIYLGTNTGYKLVFNLWRDGDQISGIMHFQPVGPGDPQGRGIVRGQLSPDGRISMTVYLQPPSPPVQILISGTISKGAGRGTLRETDWDAGESNTWLARTATDCPHWPDVPIKPTRVKEIPTDTLSNDPCRLDAKRNTFPGGGTIRMVHACKRLGTGSAAAEALRVLDDRPLLKRRNGWAASVFGSDEQDAFVNPFPSNIFPCRPGLVSSNEIEGGRGLGKDIWLIDIGGFGGCGPKGQNSIAASALPSGPAQSSMSPIPKKISSDRGKPRSNTGGFDTSRSPRNDRAPSGGSNAAMDRLTGETAPKALNKTRESGPPAPRALGTTPAPAMSDAPKALSTTTAPASAAAPKALSTTTAPAPGSEPWRGSVR